MIFVRTLVNATMHAQHKRIKKKKKVKNGSLAVVMEKGQGK
jgi:hypothetical protein